MKLHPRTLLVQEASAEIQTAIGLIWQKRRLTAIEMMSIMSHLTANYAKYPLRDERHPDDPNAKADEE